MIPDREAFLEGYYFFARRRGELARYVRRHVDEALAEATRLAADREEDEPAALFYAFARRDRAFPLSIWRSLVAHLALGHAQAVGLSPAGDTDLSALDALRMDVAAGVVEHAEVRAWFSAHFAPIPRRFWPPER